MTPFEIIMVILTVVGLLFTAMQFAVMITKMILQGKEKDNRR